MKRQPVHTVVVPADRFGSDTPSCWGLEALAALRQHGPLDAMADAAVAELVLAKLEAEPIEDLLIDFEDGYGARPDEAEDADARAAARSLLQLADDGGAPPFVGLRIKSFEPDTRARAERTLDTFLATLSEVQAQLPLRVMLPKVSTVAQVEELIAVCVAAESRYDCGELMIDLQIEVPEAILGPAGQALVAPMIAAAGPRCSGLHFGTYDYTAALGIAAVLQAKDHPAADYALAVMQVAGAAAGVPVCDGSTNVLPVGETEQVRAAWRLHGDLVTRSLGRGFYQGWDLHPAQLPSRFAATFAFFRAALPSALSRLADYAAQRTDGILDEPATARALSDVVRRGLLSGAVLPDEVPDELLTWTAPIRRSE
jgi:citrate lyase beta subunit